MNFNHLLKAIHRILCKANGLAFSIMMLILFFNLIFAGRISYSEFHRRGFVFINVVLMIAGLIFLNALKKAIWMKRRPFGKGLVILGLLLSVYVAFCTMYMTGWDAGTLFSKAIEVSDGEHPFLGYFSTYPNNRLMLSLLVIIINICHAVGIQDSSTLYMVPVVIQALLFWCTGLIVKDIISNFTQNEKATEFGYILYNLFIGLSPWISIVYTDAIGIFFPCFLLWLYIKIPENKAVISILKWIFLTVIAFIGYQIKATTFVMYIAIFMTAVIFSLNEENRKEWLGSLAVLAITGAMALSILKSGLAMKFGTYLFEKTTGTVAESEMELTPFHYLMMGLNAESYGTFNSEDSDFSIYISSYDERISREKHEIKDRVRKLGTTGVIELYNKKMLTAYNDGSFGYGIGGESGSKEFIDKMLIEDAPWNRFIRWFTIPGYGGFKYYISFLHMIWLAILLFAARLNLKNRNEHILGACLIGITIFLILFETQQRYLFIFAPIWLIAGVVGLYKHSK